MLDPKHGFDTGITDVSRNMLKFSDISKSPQDFARIALAKILLSGECGSKQLSKYIDYVEPKDF